MSRHLFAWLGTLPPSWVRLLAVSLAFLFALLWAGAPRTSPIGSLDELMRDHLLRLTLQDEEESRVSVVDIDEASLQALGPWPWPRGRLADLVETLISRYGARAVALDLVLPEGADEAGDARLAALAAHAPVTLAVAFDLVPRHPPLKHGATGPGLPYDTAIHAAAATGFLGNHGGLSGARCVGNIGFLPDADGALRRIPALVGFEGRLFPPLASALLACAGKKDGFAANLARWLPDGDETGYWRIPFRHSAEAHAVVPAWRVLDGSSPDWPLNDRLVLVGSSAFGLSDRAATPLSSSTPGVIVHAAAVSALLDREAGALPAPWPGNTLFRGWAAFTLFLVFFLLPRSSPWRAVAMLLAMSLGWMLLSAFAVARGGELAVSAPLVAYLTILALLIPYEWWLSKKESRRILETFSHYVAPEVLDQLARQRSFSPMEPSMREITVLIADMEGYTRATAQLPLKQAAELTTRFLDKLTQPVLDYGGTLDKYTGDGLVAFWGAPLPSADHADRAVRAGLLILDQIEKFNQEQASLGQPRVRVRIGIESGTALVGDLGTSFRSTYTAVGDCINLAAKLQDWARHSDSSIIIGPGARARLRQFSPLTLGCHALPGASQPLELFTVSHDDASAQAG